jgi:excisionase family DNA binding protein
MGEFFTPEEVAAKLKVSARTVKRMCAAGLLGGRRAGNRWRIPASAIAAYEAGDVTPAVTNQPAPQRTPTPIRVAPAVEEAGYVAIVPGEVPWRTSIVASPATGRSRSAGKKKAGSQR